MTRKLLARAFSTLSVLLWATLLSGCGENQTEKVQQTWDRYVASSIAKDGPATVALLSSDTIAYYEDVRMHALNSDAATVKGLPLMKKMMVLMTRVHVEPSYLQTLTGAQLVMVGVRDDWMQSTGDPKTLTLDAIRVDGDVATAELNMQGKSGGPPCRFIKEDGAWKIDLSSLLGEIENTLKSQMSRMGSDAAAVDATLPMIIGQRTGKKVGPEIWDKPKIR